MTFSLTRRAAIAGAAAAPIAATVASRPASASGHGDHAPKPLNARAFKIGDFTVHSLLAGSVARDSGMQETFAGGATDDEFATVATENFIPGDAGQFYFTPTLVDTGSEKILFDTGLNAAGITQALHDAGTTPNDIDVVVLTHMHPDHIGGMTGEDGTATFSNARFITGTKEYDFWSKMEAGNRVGDLVASKVTPQAEKMTFIDDGGAIAAGVTGVAAFGHTPGHMAIMLESAGEQMVLTADLANHYVFPFAHPEWETSFDMDKAAAIASRKNILGMLAADRIPMIGYHMPFPAAGYVETRSNGYRFVPVSYQMMG